MHSLNRAIYLTGPTASGKTEVGVRLARRLNAEIVALDSMTVYRGMDIGTAKPTWSERGGIPHHLIDVLDPWKAASVAQYRQWAIRVCEQIEAQGKLTLFVGGTALYLKALLRGLMKGPGADPLIRGRLEAEALQNGTPSLHERLSALDPATAARLHPNDKRRIVRALEVIEMTGQPLSRLQVEHDRPAPAETLVFALERPRAELYERINRRVERMFAQGLVDEVRSLQAAPQPLSSVAAQAVGYREVIEHLSGRRTLAETIEQVQTRSRQFAKRQATWCRGLAEVRPLRVLPDDDPEAIARLVAEEIETERALRAAEIQGT
jgi:tRNA dimethylallyltransferase